VSFDIVAFDPAATSNAKFMSWYEKQLQGNQALSRAINQTVNQAVDQALNQADPSVATPSLRSFYADLSVIYPPVSGPGAPTAEEVAADPHLEARLTRYRIGPQVIHAAFPSSFEETATRTFEGLAARHQVAIARVSRDPFTISRPRLAKRHWRSKRPAKVTPTDVL